MYDLLILDDEEDLRNTLSKVLVDSGYQVKIAESGVDALRILKEEPIPLLFVDISMPEMDGLEFISKIRELGTPSCIVVITAYFDQDIIVQCLQLGVADMITKPFRVKELLASIPYWLEIGRALKKIDEGLEGDLAAHVKSKIRVIDLFRLKNHRKRNL